MTADRSERPASLCTLRAPLEPGRSRLCTRQEEGAGSARTLSHVQGPPGVCRMHAPRCASALGAAAASHPQHHSIVTRLRRRHAGVRVRVKIRIPTLPSYRTPMQDAFSARTSGALLLEALLESADGAAACLQAAVAASFERAAAAKARRHSAAHRLRHPHGAMERNLRLGRPLLRPSASSSLARACSGQTATPCTSARRSCALPSLELCCMRRVARGQRAAQAQGFWCLWRAHHTGARRRRRATRPGGGRARRRCWRWARAASRCWRARAPASTWPACYAARRMIWGRAAPARRRSWLGARCGWRRGARGPARAALARADRCMRWGLCPSISWGVRGGHELRGARLPSSSMRALPGTRAIAWPAGDAAGSPRRCPLHLATSLTPGHELLGQPAWVGVEAGSGVPQAGAGGEVRARGRIPGGSSSRRGRRQRAAPAGAAA